MSKRKKDRLYKRGNIFTFKYKDPDTGKWREKFTGARSRDEALEYRDDFLRDLKERTLPSDKASWTVEQAATLWVKNHAPHLTSRKARSNEQSYLRQLVNLLGQKKLKHLTLDDLKAYQQKRGQTVQARPINIELAILVKVLKEENLWRGSLEGFKRLREPKSVIGQALTVEQLGQLESVACTNDAWQVAYYAEALASNTGLRGGEIKKLRLSNLDLEKRRLQIVRKGTKSDAGERLVQLNHAATIAACKLYVRAE
ncbi:MAG TPA: hypothetical protein VMG82_32195 [Candidatus Sulfotelmatobacter sp.]|nr:hypothetical protein [Candidatus Sulfotelmatobacter sp.]